MKSDLLARINDHLRRSHDRLAQCSTQHIDPWRSLVTDDNDPYEPAIDDVVDTSYNDL